MVVYLDSSVLARAYLADEPGHREGLVLLDDTDLGLVTATWTRMEVSGALVRAARTGRGDVNGLLAPLDSDLGTNGKVTLVGADQLEVEQQALRLVRERGRRPMAAWHLAVAGPHLAASR